MLAVERSAGRVALGADLTYSGNRIDVAFPSTVHLAGYTLVNATARFAVTDRWWVQARLDNALDESYTLVHGYNTPGRSFTLATRFAFQ